MFELIIGTNTSRNKVICDLNSTLREALEAADIDYSVGSIHLDGASLQPGDIDRTFADMGITTTARLVQVVKGDAA